jgi:nitrite reductase/ring-hydroxylating ferredoxin subunit
VVATITESTSWCRVCRLEELAEGCARGFDTDPVSGDDRAFAVRSGGRVYAYVNSCPHNWRPLEYAKDRFLSGDGVDIVCYAHGAHFDIEDGRCSYGPCLGQSLRALPVEEREGWIWAVTE